MQTEPTRSEARTLRCPMCRTPCLGEELLCRMCGSAIVSGATDVRELREALRRSGVRRGGPRFGPATLVPLDLYMKIGDTTVPVGVPCPVVRPLSGPLAEEPESTPESTRRAAAPLPVRRWRGRLAGALALVAVLALVTVFGGTVGSGAEVARAQLAGSVRAPASSEVAVAPAPEHAALVVAPSEVAPVVVAAAPVERCEQVASLRVRRSRARGVALSGAQGFSKVRVRATRGGGEVRFSASGGGRGARLELDARPVSVALWRAPSDGSEHVVIELADGATRVFTARGGVLEADGDALGCVR